MNTKNIGTLVAGTAVSSLLSLASATAAILVEPVLTTPDPNLPPVPIGFGVNPGTVVAWNAPDISGQQNFLNAGTGVNINTMELFLLPELDELDDELIWGDVNGDGQIGVSDIFDNIEVDNSLILKSPDGLLQFQAPRVTFTGGVIPLGTRFVVQILTEPDLTVPPEVEDAGPLVVGGRYDGVPVPEPSTILGLVSALGFGVLFNKKSSQKTGERGNGVKG